MHPDDRRVDAWEASPGPLVLAVMALAVLVALPFAFLIFLADLLFPARDAGAAIGSGTAALRRRA